VSLNLTNFPQTPFEDIWSTVAQEAARLGTSIASSQLIGFVPQRAYTQAPGFFRRAENFDESRILENRIAQLIK
jgi:glutamate formiminotransferase